LLTSLVLLFLVPDPLNSGVQFNRYSNIILQQYGNAFLLVAYFGIGIIWLDAILKRNVIHNFSKKVMVVYISFVFLEAGLTSGIMGAGAFSSGDISLYLDILQGGISIIILTVILVNYSIFIFHCQLLKRCSR
jgi:hypothetical protein